MGHPAVENATGFAFEPVFLADEDGRPLLVPLVKATYDIGPTSLTLAAEQQPPVFEGVANGDLEVASWRYEPEGSLPKVATDVVLVGSAVAPRAGIAELMVALQVGPLRKGVRVIGDRVFFRSVGGVGMSRPAEIERIPLDWERAFGGWDRSLPEESKHTFEPRNPVGVGYRGSGARFEDGLPCPNLEDPARPFRGWGDRPPPAGFGFTSPNWEPRVKYAGTYDERWQKERAPLLPRDFDRRFLSAASPGLVANGYLRGDEPVVVSGVAAEGGYSFRLPGVTAPAVTVQRLGVPDAAVSTHLDTVVVDTDERKVFLFWRGALVLRREPTEVRTLVVGGPGAPSQGAAGAA